MNRGFPEGSILDLLSFFFFGFDSRYGLFSNFTPSTNDTFPFSVIYDISMPSKVLNKDLKNIENRHSDGK